MHVFADPVCAKRHIRALRSPVNQPRTRRGHPDRGAKPQPAPRRTRKETEKMTYQVETTATTAEELDTEALDLVVGGVLTCRKAGGDQTEYAAPPPPSIIVVC